MKFNKFRASESAGLGPGASQSRRRFVQGLVGGGLFASGQGVFGDFTKAATSHRETLRGRVFNLTIEEVMANFTGSPRKATAINGSIPGPTLHWREGEEVVVNVTNRLRETTSLHWHGMILPYQMDGVPGLSFGGIAPGETFQYRFKVQQHGTYWYHSHSAFQEMTGMYGAIVIEPAAGERIQSDREHQILLSEWTDEDPMYVFQKLKTMGHLYNFNQPTMPEFFRDVSAGGLEAAFSKRDMFNTMRMKPTDLADLSANTLTYLINGVTPAGNQSLPIAAGERVRLRIVNGAGNTFFDVRIPGLPMTVVHVDGIDVEPVTVDEFRMGAGETIDVLVFPSDEPYTFFAETMDRSGFARATLTPREGLTAPLPQRREPQWLSMGDMMGAGSHSGHGAAMTEPSAHVDHGAMMAEPKPHAGHGAAMAEPNPHAGHGAAMTEPNAHAGHGGAMTQPLTHTGQTPEPAASGHSMMASAAPTVRPARHASSEFGASTDMRVDIPRVNLDDPGVGLRGASHRVLTLADLKGLDPLVDQREPEREIELHLTGNMERYSWSIDGLEYRHSTPIHFRHGERLRVHLHNDTMMTHPMHLHGMWSDLEDANGQFLTRRHTLPVQPAQRVSFSVTADALGRWAWHCHLLLHMDGGMFREVVVA